MIQPPTHISPDGREVWDWAERLSHRAQVVSRGREVRADIRRLSSECGSCTLWMTKRCPREVHDNLKGYSRGPSMSAPACGKFEMKAHYAELVARKQAELDDVLRELSGEGTPQPAATEGE